MNSAMENGGGYYSWWEQNMVLNNSIMWGNVPNQIFANGSPIPSNVNITYSDIMDSLDGVQHIGNGSISWGQGNINQDPMFCDPDNGNNNLAENSPCVGTGENGANMGALGVGCGPGARSIGSDEDLEPSHSSSICWATASGGVDVVSTNVVQVFI